METNKKKKSQRDNSNFYKMLHNDYNIEKYVKDEIEFEKSWPSKKQ